MSLPSVKPNMCSVSTSPVLSVRLPAAAWAALAAPSMAKINTVIHVVASGTFFEARTDRQCKNIMRHPVEIQTHAHGGAVCRTVQISDEDFGGRSSKIGSALSSVRKRGATNRAGARLKTAAGVGTGMRPAK